MLVTAHVNEPAEARMSSAQCSSDSDSLLSPKTKTRLMAFVAGRVLQMQTLKLFNEIPLRT